MKYKEALAAARGDVAHALGLPHLAITISALAQSHAICAEQAYDGAVKRGLNADQVRKLDPVALGNLMWV